MTRRAKRIWSWVVALLLFLALVVLLLPLWLPWLLRPVVPLLNSHYESYERLGYDRFALSNVRYADRFVRVEAERVESQLPSGLLLNRLAGTDFRSRVENWSVTVTNHPTRKKSGRTKTNTVASVTKQVEQIVDEVVRWFPNAELTNGLVHVAGRTIEVPWLVSQGRQVEAQAALFLPAVGRVPLRISLHRHAPGSVSAQLTVPTLDLRSKITMVRAGSAMNFTATNLWNTNRVLWSVEFGNQSLPTWATVSAPMLQFNPTNATLGYGEISGGLRGIWTNRTFEVRLALTGVNADTNFPSISGSVSARGDTDTVTLQDLHLETPALRMDLSNSLRFTYAGELLSGPARLSITGDLSRLPGAKMQGQALGDLKIEPGDTMYPNVSLRCALTNFSSPNLELTQAQLDAQLRWPLLRVETLAASFKGGAEFRAMASANATNRNVSELSARFSGRLPTNIIPASLQYSNVSVVADASGPITNLTHQLKATVEEVRWPPLASLNLDFHERGEGFRLANFRALASAPEVALEIRGAGEWKERRIKASLMALNLWRGKTTPLRERVAQQGPFDSTPFYSLAEPVTVELGGPGNAKPDFRVSPLLWQGEGRRLKLEGSSEWPSVGQWQVSAAGLATSDFTNFFASTWPSEAILTDFASAVRWSNGPVRLTLDAAVEVQTTNAPAFIVALAVTNNAEAIHIEKLQLTLRDPSTAQPGDPIALLVGEALLPVSARGTSGSFEFELHKDAPARVELHTSTNDVLPQLVREFARANVVEPSLHVTLGGTVRQPQGTVRLAAKSMMPLTLTNEMLPELKEIRADVAFDLDKVHLRELHATLAGQSMVGTAEIPLSKESDWRSRLQFDQARADLRIPSAELAAFAPYATNLLAPRGILDVNMTLRPGFQLSGHLRITNGATASFPTIGPVQDIDAQIRLQNKEMLIETLNSYVGGAVVAIGGSVNFANWNPGTNRWPVVRLRLAGNNIALVRESQTILRTDLDLTVTNPGAATPTIAGNVNLRDSLFLAELKDLVPSGVTRPGQRPPYFSVDASLLRDWTLNVQVRGDRFMTVRTPFFRGEVSTDLKVLGKLEAPRAIGDLRINVGRINFPFATLTVQQGFVTLSSADPYRPQLFVTASGQAFDYEIRVQVTGTAQKPVLEFSSIPPLTSEQVLLMVTAGQVPRSDYSLSPEQRAQRLGMFVGKNLISQFGLGGNGEKLTIRSGENISETGRETYSIEYKLTEDLSLVGEYDRFDEYNAGIKWRVFSK